MHKNTFLFASILAVIAALLIGVNVGKNLTRTQTPLASPTPKVTPTPTLTYLSGTTCGITFLYPNSMRAMESSISGMILAHTSQPEESVVVLCQSDIPRAPIDPKNIEEIPIDNSTGIGTVSAKLYHEASEKDGAPIDKLIFTHPKTKLDVFIAGYGATFRQLISSVQVQ